MSYQQAAADIALPGTRSLQNRGYIVGPLYDAVFFIGSPLLALLLGIALFGQPELRRTIGFEALNPRYAEPLLLFAIKVFIEAHLVLVFFRSHLNSKIYALHPVRFRVVPLLLLLAAITSQWFLIFLTVLAIWWDVYHSALQTFGLGRIYDLRHGNDLEAGRRADRILNIAIYVGPILAGANLWSHLKHFELFARVDSQALASIAGLVFAQSEAVRAGVFAVGIPVVVGYLLNYRRLVRRGYEVPPQKLALLVSTAVCSIAAWGFLPPAPAFFVMNFFHAFQYFAIVWWSERANTVSLLGLGALPFRKFMALLVLVLPAFAYGFWVVVRPGKLAPAIVAVAVVVSILHFWYDGFIWSVRKRQV